MITSVSSSSWLGSVCAALVCASVRRGTTSPRREGGGGGLGSAGCEYQLAFDSGRLLVCGPGRGASALRLGSAGQAVARARVCCAGLCVPVCANTLLSRQKGV